MADHIPEPRWTSELPRLYHSPHSRYRTLPSFAMSYPGSTAFDLTRSFALALRRRCALCGCQLGNVVWNLFMTDSPAESDRRHHDDDTGEGYGRWHPGDVWTAMTPAAMHKSCLMYATLVCPYLRYPTSRRPLNRTTLRGEAVIYGFKKFGISFFDEAVELDDKRMPEQPAEIKHLFGYAEPVERIDYVKYQDNFQLYRQSLTEDEWISTGGRLYWETPDELTALASQKHTDAQTIAILRTNAFYRAHTGHVYRLSVL